MDETVASGPGTTSPADRLEEPAGSPLVVSIVVNFRGRSDTLACVQSLLNVDYANQRVVVVENGSGGAEAEALAAALPAAVTLLVSNTNLGYGGAANLGLRRAVEAGAAYAWILNNDTTVDVTSVAELVRAMASDPRCGASSPQIEAPIGDEAPRGVWYAGGNVNLRRVSTKHALDLVESDALLVPTGFVTGCAMFLRLAAVAEVGPFWERLFLYWEDVELSLRLSAAGWGLAVVPAARIRHLVHGSVQSAVARYYYYRNATLVARRCLGVRGAARAFLALSSRAGRRWLACTIKGRRPWPGPETRGLFAGAIAVLRGGGRSRPEGSAAA
jgi:GT2 family glycosyltransferase